MFDTEISTVVLVLIAIAALVIYFLPTIIASGRNSTATFLIFLINLFGGWTVALWIFVFIWAFCAKKKS
jgi:hypothetical protein